METPSDDDKVTEDQNDDAGTEAAAADDLIAGSKREGNLPAGDGITDDTAAIQALADSQPDVVTDTEQGDDEPVLGREHSSPDDSEVSESDPLELDPLELETRPADVVDVSGAGFIDDATEGTLTAGGPRASTDNLPTYLCDKRVRAFKIAAAEAMAGGAVRLSGVDPAHFVIVVADYVDKHHPKIGGYYVRYHDGYQSWSPAAAFEDGYTLIS